MYLFDTFVSALSISLYLHGCTGKCQGIHQEDTTQAETVCGTVHGLGRACAALIPIQIKILLLLSKRRPRQRRVVSGPDYGPGVDVEQGAALLLPPVAVADAPWKTAVLAM